MRGNARAMAIAAVAAIAAMILPHGAALACGRCAPLVRAQVFGAGFLGELCLLGLPLAVLWLLIPVVARLRLLD